MGRRGGGRKESDGSALRRLDKIFDRYKGPSGECAFCDQTGEYRLPDYLLEGLDSSFVCRSCHEKVVEIENIFGQLCGAIERRDCHSVVSAVTALAKLKRWLPLRTLEAAIDLVRNTPDRHELYSCKNRLTILLLHQYGDKLNCVIRADNRLEKPNIAKVSWWSHGEHWSCHVPAGLLTGRFREMFLATQE